MSRIPPPIFKSESTRTAECDKIVVGVADMAVARDAHSCIGVTLYDPVAKVAGMLHFMLPESTVSPDKAAINPAMFGDAGLPLLFQKVLDAGARRERLIVCAAGGAEVLADDGHFRIGNRNRTVLRKIFWKLNLLLASDDTGGQHSRTMTLRLIDGQISIRSQGKDSLLWPH